MNFQVIPFVTLNHNLRLLGLATPWKISAIIVWSQLQILGSSIKIFYTDYIGNPLLTGAPIKPQEHSSCIKPFILFCDKTLFWASVNNGTGNTT